MKEVSCRHFSFWFQLVEQNGCSIERALARIPQSREFLLEPGNRIDWDDYLVFCEDCVEELGGIERVRQIPQLYGNTGDMGYLRKIVGLFASPRRVYEFIILKHGKSLYTHLDFQLVDLPDGRLQIRIRIPDGYRDSPIWFLGSEPLFKDMTRLIGLPSAKIETEVRERLGIYTLELPQSRTLVSLLRRVGRGLSAPLGFLQFVNSQQAELRRLVSEMESERDNLNHLIANLPSGILILRGDHMLFANDILYRLLGLPREIPLRNASDLGPLPLDEARSGRRFNMPSGLVLEITSRSEIVYHGQSAEMLVVRDITAAQRIEERIARVAARERQKLVHDLHDGLGQYFAALNYKASVLASDAGVSSEAVEQIATLAREAATFSRGIAHGVDTGDADVITALRKLCGQMQTFFPAECLFESNVASAQAVNATEARELFLLFKEAFTNAARHAQADRITLAIRRPVSGWQISLRDDGKGFDAAQVIGPGSGQGLQSLQLRAARIGGELTIRSQPGNGCEIVIDLPENFLRETPAPQPVAPPMPAPRPTGTTARIFLVDDHAIVRDGVRRLIEAEDGLCVCGEHHAGDNLVNLVQKADADTLVIDWVLGEGTSEDSIVHLRSEIPHLRIIVLTMFAEERYRERAFLVGANGFVSKAEPPGRLLEALRPAVSA